MRARSKPTVIPLLHLIINFFCLLSSLLSLFLNVLSVSIMITLLTSPPLSDHLSILDSTQRGVLTHVISLSYSNHNQSTCYLSFAYYQINRIDTFYTTSIPGTWQRRRIISYRSVLPTAGHAAVLQPTLQYFRLYTQLMSRSLSCLPDHTVIK